MSYSSMPSTFLKNVLNNGIGRYVCQLQRVTIKFCKSQAGSRGTREFIENHLVDFAREHPGVVIYVKPRRHRTPLLVGEYLNGKRQYVNLMNMPSEEVCQWLEHLRTRSGVDIIRFSKLWRTSNPSIQGQWTAFTNKDTALNVTEFPSDELAEFKPDELSATEKLIKLTEELKISGRQTHNKDFDSS